MALEMYKRRRDRQGTASALAGEIASILYMTNKRGHIQFFEQLLPKLERGEDVSVPALAPSGDFRDPVAEKYIDRLGLLPSNAAERIVRFYTLLAGVRADIQRMVAGEFKDPAAKAYVVREDLQVWAEAAQLGEQLVSELRKIASPRARVHAWVEAGQLDQRVGVIRDAARARYQQMRDRLKH